MNAITFDVASVEMPHFDLKLYPGQHSSMVLADSPPPERTSDHLFLQILSVAEAEFQIILGGNTYPGRAFFEEMQLELPKAQHGYIRISKPLTPGPDAAKVLKQIGGFLQKTHHRLIVGALPAELKTFIGQQLAGSQ